MKRNDFHDTSGNRMEMNLENSALDSAHSHLLHYADERQEQEHGNGEDGSSSLDPVSFIKTAASSLLDEIISGDDDSMTVSDDNTNHSRSDPISPSLRSLQTQRPPAIPDEQDRKRFVGCLAAVLASTYDYEELDLADDELSRDEINDYLAFSADDDDDEHDATDPPIYSSSIKDFDYLDCNQGFCANHSAQSGRGRSAQEPNRQSDRNKLQAARMRLRKRRYDVLSRLLLSLADLLQLEKGQVKAFLPILSKLLISNNHKNHRRATMHTRSAAGTTQYPSTPNDKNISCSDPKHLYSAAVHSFSDVGSSDFYTHQLNRIEHLRPFLESITPGAGFRCLTMFLLQHLLNSQEGYDARIRHAIKTVAVFVLVRDMENDAEDMLLGSELENRRTKGSQASRIDLVEIATRTFEALEMSVASRLILLSREQERLSHVRGQRPERLKEPVPVSRTEGLTREEVLRGLKVGGTALLAGTLFAVTGGLAAPGIAAGMGMLMGGTAITAAAATVLTSTAAVTTIFGVGGGGLAAYKMHRRTEGLTEFKFQKELSKSSFSGELFTMIAVSGWLRDECDFQRPWGVTPTSPRITNRLELLERFYSVHRPDHVRKCRKILQSWEGEEKDLWKLLKKRYGSDPGDPLFPLNSGSRHRAPLTLEQEELITELPIELDLIDLVSLNRNKVPSSERIHVVKNLALREAEPVRRRATSSVKSSLVGSMPISGPGSESGGPSHLATVWSFADLYGGELYTIRWESDLLTELCYSVNDLALELVTGSTAQVLKHTALATLMSAIALPYALVSAANMIDGTWTLAVERADLAGKELARSLLSSRAGSRPVTLIGYSFGARLIYACVKQLAIYQSQWEEYQDTGRLQEQDNDGDCGSLDYGLIREPAGIVEDAIMMGLPNHLSLSSWKACRQIVAGRLINCFSNKGLILSLMFQFKRLGLKPVCGTCPVNVAGVENIDVSDFVQGHQDYCFVIGAILERVRLSQPFASRPTHLFVPKFNRGKS